MNLSEPLVIDGQMVLHGDGTPVTRRFALAWGVAWMILAPTFIAAVFWAALHV